MSCGVIDVPTQENWRDAVNLTRNLNDYDGPVLFDCMVEKHENCLPMIPSGKPHNEMILPDSHAGAGVSEAGKMLV